MRVRRRLGAATACVCLLLTDVVFAQERSAREFAVDKFFEDLQGWSLAWVMLVTALMLSSLIPALTNVLRGRYAAGTKWAAVSLLAPAIAFVVAYKMRTHAMWVTLEITKRASVGALVALACAAAARAEPSRAGLRLFLVAVAISSAGYSYMRSTESGLVSLVRPTELLEWLFVVCLGAISVRVAVRLLSKREGEPAVDRHVAVLGILGVGLLCVTVNMAYTRLVDSGPAMDEIHQAVTESRRKVKSLSAQRDRIRTAIKNDEEELKSQRLTDGQRRELENSIKERRVAADQLDSTITKSEELVWLAERIEKDSRVWSTREVEVVTKVLADAITEEIAELDRGATTIAGAIQTLEGLLAKAN